MTIELVKPWRHWKAGDVVSTLSHGSAMALIEQGYAKRPEITRKVLAPTPSDKSRTRKRR